MCSAGEDGQRISGIFRWELEVGVGKNLGRRRVMRWCRSGCLLILAPLFLATCDFGARPDEIPAVKPTFAYKLTPSHVDLGPVDPSELARFELLLENKGTQAIWVERVASTCSCVVGLTSRVEVAPGQSEIVAVDFEGSRLRGKFKKGVFLFLSAELEGLRKTQVTVGGEVGKLVDLQPSRIQLGRVLERTTRSEIIVRTKTLSTIEKVSISGPMKSLVNVSSSSPVPNDGQWEHRLTIVIERNGAAGQTVEVDCLVEVTVAGRTRTLKIEVSADLVGDYQISPAKFYATRIRKGQIVNAVFSLSWETTDAVTIRRVVLGTQDLEFKITRSSKKRVRVEVKIPISGIRNRGLMTFVMGDDGRVTIPIVVVKKRPFNFRSSNPFSK